MILITTPGGKVGHELVQQLTEQQCEIRLASHNPDRIRSIFPAAEVIAAEIDDPSRLERALEGVDALFLASPGVLVSDDKALTPAELWVRAAQRTGVQRLVRLSAAGVEYSEGQLRQIEQLVEGSGVDWTLLRPNWFMQNYSTPSTSSMNAAAVRQGILREPAGDARTSYIDTRDIAAVAVQALTQDGHSGQAYTLTGAEALSRHEVAAIFARVLGREVTYQATGEAEMRADMRAAGANEAYVETMSSLYGLACDGATEGLTDTVQRLTGQTPRSFEKFVRDHAALWRL